MCGFHIFTQFLQIVNVRTTNYFVRYYILLERTENIWCTFDASKIATIIFAFIMG